MAERVTDIDENRYLYGELIRLVGRMGDDKYVFSPLIIVDEKLFAYVYNDSSKEYFIKSTIEPSIPQMVLVTYFEAGIISPKLNTFLQPEDGDRRSLCGSVVSSINERLECAPFEYEYVLPFTIFAINEDRANRLTMHSNPEKLKGSGHFRLGMFQWQRAYLFGDTPGMQPVLMPYLMINGE